MNHVRSEKRGAACSGTSHVPADSPPTDRKVSKSSIYMGLRNGRIDYYEGGNDMHLALWV